MNNSDNYPQLQALQKQYGILEKIGEGGCGCIFKAEQLSTGQLVAIKTSKNDRSWGKDLARRVCQQFVREVNICARINHPNIIQLIDAGFLSEFEPFAVFEYIPGETLKKYILRNRYLSYADMANIMGQVLQALVHAHENGVLHGDLKPNNIMINHYGDKQHVKVLDLGTGYFIGKDTKSIKGINADKNVPFVSPQYNAPEQLRGNPPSSKSDLYSWGLIVLECITGQAVVSGQSMSTVFEQQLNTKDVELPDNLKYHDLGQLLQQVLKKDWSERYGDTKQLLREFTKLDFADLRNCSVIDHEIGNLNLDHTIVSVIT